MARKELRIGMLGGSFDPIHAGHLALSAAACRSLGLDRLLLVPARIPPHKPGRRLAAPSDRMRMARLAATDLRRRGHPVFADPIELESRGLSYTVRTLRALRRRSGAGARLFLILGSDELALFPEWKCPREIMKLATLAVAQRPGAPLKPAMERVRRRLKLAPTAPPWLTIRMRPVDVSATRLRERYGGQAGIRRSRAREQPPLPTSVARYLRRHGLYQPHPLPPQGAKRFSCGS